MFLDLMKILIPKSTRILKYFNTNPEKYSVIFTSGATGALKTVSEYFSWDNDDYKGQLKNAGEIDMHTTKIAYSKMNFRGHKNYLRSSGAN